MAIARIKLLKNTNAIPKKRAPAWPKTEFSSIAICGRKGVQGFISLAHRRTSFGFTMSSIPMHMKAKSNTIKKNIPISPQKTSTP